MPARRQVLDVELTAATGHERDGPARHVDGNVEELCRPRLALPGYGERADEGVQLAGVEVDHGAGAVRGRYDAHRLREHEVHRDIGDVDRDLVVVVRGEDRDEQATVGPGLA